MKKLSKKHVNMQFEEIHIKITPDDSGYIIGTYSFKENGLLYFNILHDELTTQDEVEWDLRHTENHASSLGENFRNSFKEVEYLSKFLPTPEKEIDLQGLNFTEKELEVYLSNNLQLIEEGMTFIENQYKIQNGYIDILAKDKNNKTCIIEIKVKPDDHRLIEQSVYYPTQFKEDVRMITIAPSYSYKNYQSLKSLQNVELKYYKVLDEKIIIKNYLR